MDSLQLLIAFSVLVYLAVWGCVYFLMLPVIEWMLSMLWLNISEDWFKLIQVVWCVVCMVGCYLSVFLTWGYLL